MAEKWSGGEQFETQPDSQTHQQLVAESYDNFLGVNRYTEDTSSRYLPDFEVDALSVDQTASNTGDTSDEVWNGAGLAATTEADLKMPADVTEPPSGPIPPDETFFDQTPLSDETSGEETLSTDDMSAHEASADEVFVDNEDSYEDTDQLQLDDSNSGELSEGDSQCGSNAAQDHNRDVKTIGYKSYSAKLDDIRVDFAKGKINAGQALEKIDALLEEFERSYGDEEARKEQIEELERIKKENKILTDDQLKTLDEQLTDLKDIDATRVIFNLAALNAEEALKKEMRPYGGPERWIPTTN